MVSVKAAHLSSSPEEIPWQLKHHLYAPSPKRFPGTPCGFIPKTPQINSRPELAPPGSSNRGARLAEDARRHGAAEGAAFRRALRRGVFAHEAIGAAGRRTAEGLVGTGTRGGGGVGGGNEPGGGVGASGGGDGWQESGSRGTKEMSFSLCWTWLVDLQSLELNGMGRGGGSRCNVVVSPSNLGSRRIFCYPTSHFRGSFKNCEGSWFSSWFSDKPFVISFNCVVISNAPVDSLLTSKIKPPKSFDIFMRQVMHGHWGPRFLSNPHINGHSQHRPISCSMGIHLFWTRDV